ncbi:FdhF/YdeP family oxidoreductase [Paludisphaera mucosa]|uniref:FdhF/YdeP family oxidoreductase n=1 Tax=Paludisphaera mucosa TaxID=3030827 RepID=A0ABT6F9U7_9BACT|nr:FdhF/YdeP family oxidoreductase [Paludisphaera mucosa]MDG3004341.1 FdhF/YdeP family oxidoreductase [Paludisphaera mucosa]
MSDEDRRPEETPTTPAVGFGPNAGGAFSQEDYHHPAAGWGAAISVGKVLVKQREVLDGARVVFDMNHENGGYDCPGCAWPDDRHGLTMDICENGIKHATWEMTKKKATPEFFAAHTVSELATWTDFALEDAGRLTEPMRYDAASDKYVAVTWDEAFALVGKHVRGLGDPNRAAFYTSGRLSNEATFLLQLWARELGTNNLPDCSNMCHEASGRAMQAAIGTGKGTCDLVDWQKTDCLIVMGVNAASNAPRMLTSLAEAYRRGASIVHINPLVEAAARRTIVPHDILRMATFQSTKTSTLNIQPRIAGDLALMRGIAKHLFEAVAADPKAIDHCFIENHTSGFEAYRSRVEATSWAELERQSGVPTARIRELGEVYRKARAAIIGWCLGVTQQEHAGDTIREIVNVLLLRGNIGREGAGPCPIRGHSNVQGNRTCGIDHRPGEAWLARLDQACGITSPRAHGLDTVRVIPAMARGDVKVFVALGGNFALAAPDPAYTFPALRNCDLTVQVSTKLNRSHVVHGRDALILPCLGRTEKDHGATGLQGITVEDSMSMVHLSFGMKEPRSPHLRPEPAIIAGMAAASLTGTKTPWSVYAGDYDRIRDTMAEAIEGFEDFNRRVRQPLGFRLKQPARELVFLTKTGRAEFSDVPLPDAVPAPGRLILGTMRSHDQWNTTIYSDDDRYRGVKNLRTLVFMNADDMRERGLAKYDLIDVTSFAKDGSTRAVRGYRALPYDLPRGSAMGYMPELNVLCPIGDYSPQSDQPLMKHVVVEVVPSRLAAPRSEV